MPLRSATKFFEEGSQVICVHDTKDLKVGDVKTVWQVCDDCLGLLFQDDINHYQDIHFEKFSDEKFIRIHPDHIEKQKVVNVFTDLCKVIMMNSHRGVFYIDGVIDCIKHNLQILDLTNDFKMPLNKPEDTPEND